MPNNSEKPDDLRRKIEDLNNQLSQTADTAKRSEIESQIADAKQQLKDLEGQPYDPEDPDRPAGQFFNTRELVEMALVGGGGALGGLIAYCFSIAGIWKNFVPATAGVLHCIGAGALAAGLTVWFVARTDRNRRVPCLLFSILCGLGGIQMIEKAANTILPQANMFPNVIGKAKVSADQATAASQELQTSSAPDKVQEATQKIDQVGDSIHNLSQALTTAKEQGDTSAANMLDKSLADATQSLAKIKLESQSIPEVSKKAEDVLSKVPADVAKTAEQKELEALKDKYLRVAQMSGWCFLGTFHDDKWDRKTTASASKPDDLKGKEIAVTTPVYLRDASPSGPDYKLGQVVNVFFEGDTIRIADVKMIQRGDGLLRIWAEAALVKRAGNSSTNLPNVTASPTASVSPPETTPESSPAKRRLRRHSR